MLIQKCFEGQCPGDLQMQPITPAMPRGVAFGPAEFAADPGTRAATWATPAGGFRINPLLIVLVLIAAYFFFRKGA